MGLSSGQEKEQANRCGRLAWIVLVVSLLVIATFLLAPPWTVLGKTKLVGYAICHQIGERSFHINGQQLPLCARCTGIYMGALAGFTLMWLMGRKRASLPPTSITLVFVSFIVALGIDGINHQSSLLPGSPDSYGDQSIL